MSFVSHSVEGLKPENVTVMDVNGNLLSENLVESTGDTAYISANQLALKQEYEKKICPVHSNHVRRNEREPAKLLSELASRWISIVWKHIRKNIWNL